MRSYDVEEREEEILGLIIKSYIKETRPISSSYLCNQYHLSYSPATVRNTMEALEKKGLLMHTHVSSGRVPTRQAFKQYVNNFNQENFRNQYQDILNFAEPRPNHIADVEDIADYILDVLTEYSGYMSLVAIAKSDEIFVSKRMRFILEQPEFEDINRLKALFYMLEVKMNSLQNLLFSSIDDNIKIFVGDDMGFEELSDCSLVVSGLRKEQLAFAFALLGPIRMDYIRATKVVYNMKNKLNNILLSL